MVGVRGFAFQELGVGTFQNDGQFPGAEGLVSLEVAQDTTALGARQMTHCRPSRVMRNISQDSRYDRTFCARGAVQGSVFRAGYEGWVWGHDVVMAIVLPYRKTTALFKCEVL